MGRTPIAPVRGRLLNRTYIHHALRARLRCEVTPEAVAAAEETLLRTWERLQDRIQEAYERLPEARRGPPGGPEGDGLPARSTPAGPDCLSGGPYGTHKSFYGKSHRPQQEAEKGGKA